MIKINGSSGGRIISTALSLSVITQKPCHIFSIGQSREKPGLAPGQPEELRAISDFCGGRLEGVFLGSQEIFFSPGEKFKERIRVKLDSQSITLALQALLPAVFYSKRKITLDFDGGATDTFFSPTFEYFNRAFLHFLRQMGAQIEVEVLKKGYYPAGGAKVKAQISPSKLKPLLLDERGSLCGISIFSGASLSLRDKKIAERQSSGAREILLKTDLPLTEKIDYHQTDSPGNSICLTAVFEKTILAADSLGKIGMRAEDVGKEAALDLLNQGKGSTCLDKYMSDQILIYLALAGGKSEFSSSEITAGLKTNILIIEKFMAGKFALKNSLVSFSAF